MSRDSAKIAELVGCAKKSCSKYRSGICASGRRKCEERVLPEQVAIVFDEKNGTIAVFEVIE